MSIYSAESAELSALKGLRRVSFLTAPSVGRPRPSSAVPSLGPDVARAPAGQGGTFHCLCAADGGVASDLHGGRFGGSSNTRAAKRL